MPNARMGRVRKYDPKKGYGFIVQANGPDVFVHNTAIRMQGFRYLNKDDIVSYEVIETKRGPQAENVRVVRTDDSLDGKLNRMRFELFKAKRKAGNLLVETANLVNDAGELIEEKYGLEQAQLFYNAANQLVDKMEKGSKLDDSVEGLVSHILDILGTA